MGMVLFISIVITVVVIGLTVMATTRAYRVMDEVKKQDEADLKRYAGDEDKDKDQDKD
ncbi:MAG: hypothetical protein H0Z33_14955 [Bacillaceae bacterium]|nr:hypothetical protein [Bacillaceae bacterium]